jgi:hypothetical protein
MAFIFEQLSEETRASMLHEFESEQGSANPYFGKNLSTTGRVEFRKAMVEAIKNGNEGTLTIALDNGAYWNPTEEYERNGVIRSRNINIRQASERLANTEFNTWYVRGLSKLGMDAGITQCEVYRASEPKWSPADCTQHEGATLVVADVYHGHRAKYWPEPGNESALSVPFGPGCHHTIRLKIK